MQVSLTTRELHSVCILKENNNLLQLLNTKTDVDAEWNNAEKNVLKITLENMGKQKI